MRKNYERGIYPPCSGKFCNDYYNGSILTQRDTCDNWTGENVHLENIRLNRGENKMVLRVTRVNAEAKFNITFSRGATCAEHIVDLASGNPFCF